MSHRTAAWLAWSNFAVALACLVAFSIISLTAPNTAPDAAQGLPGDLLFALALLGFPLVGALIASHHPENPIGWLFCSVTLTFVGAVAESLALHVLAADPDVPAGAWLAWFSVPVQTLGFMLLTTFTLLLYPTGRLPSRRWRPVVWLTSTWLALIVLAWTIAPGPLGGGFPQVNNPLGIDGLAAAARLGVAVANPIIVALSLAAAASLVVRYRRAVPAERQQIKWFAFAAVWLIAVLGFLVVFDVFAPVTSGTMQLDSIMVAPPMAALPIATGFAILRYRLYDIDLIIRRTLIYGVLTAALALVYFGSVVLLQSAFRALSGETSQLVIVASTLAIVALFSPLRRRVQDFIDQRFYRRRYNAAHILSEFAATARDETDLDRLAARLVAVVDEAMRPTEVSLWLRPTAPARPSRPESTER